VEAENSALRATLSIGLTSWLVFTLASRGENPPVLTKGRCIATPMNSTRPTEVPLINPLALGLLRCFDRRSEHCEQQ